MLRTHFVLFSLVLGVFANACALAGDQSHWPASFVASLAKEKAWLALGHYREQSWGRGSDLSSEVDDDAFFLNPRGQADSEAELLATLIAFNQPASIKSLDQHPQCRFPARYHWLAARVQADGFTLPAQVECPELNQWLNSLSIGSLTLVFPAAYLNSPSSMFGHTFLRLDRAERNNDIIAQTVNYSADANAMDNQFSYAWKGLFGGYPGIITVQPYYDKVKEYSDIENRDIWEYRLKFRRSEILQLLRHVWELGQQSRFDYFFMDENCAYRLLALLEVARPSLDLVNQFPLVAIPSNTVRAVAQAGLIESAEYRGSAVTKLQTKLAQVSTGEGELAYELALVDESGLAAITSKLDELPPNRQAVVLEVAYDFLRYRSVDRHLPRTETNAKRSLFLLRTRSKIAQSAGLVAPVRPKVRPDQGHGTRLIAAGFGQRDERGFFSFRFRPTYHGLLDPPEGYQKGASIRLLDTQVRLYNQGVIRLESLELLGITSLSERDIFFRPVSWQLSTGLKRKLFDDDRFIIAYLQGSAGVAFGVPGGSLAMMFTPKIEMSGNYQRNYSAGFGGDFRYLYQGLGGQGEVIAQHGVYLLGDEHVNSVIQVKHVINLGKEHALNLSFLREKAKGEYDTEVTLGFEHFF